MSTTEPIWLKSTYSGGGGGNCIEVAACAEAVLVRDSKDTDKPALTVSPDAWSAFTALSADPRL
ncbi:MULTISPECIES: DUF397 domain-containing protein [Streptomyces]|uniref:DUF397 domain-containing protein n=1 Tax=Streptomyces TaxID=1883 RepID=UPI0018A85B49|nr:MULTISPECIES: DUF397 domain-containing protein [Streptomyces]MBF8171426.1 DUF397 domain-containing protein [Streptomyces olivaceus]MCM8551809.1 DUF397 domain-containing protein [Streptomyces sp. STCH 565 A]